MFGDIQIKKDEILKEIKTLDILDMEGLISSEDYEKKVSLLNDFEELLLKEKISCKQKAKIQWSKEGDVNSKLFHKVATRRKRKSLIKELVFGEG